MCSEQEVVGVVACRLDPGHTPWKRGPALRLTSSWLHHVSHGLDARTEKGIAGRNEGSSGDEGTYRHHSPWS